MNLTDKIFDTFEVLSEDLGQEIKIKLNDNYLESITKVCVELDSQNIKIKLVQDDRENVLVRPRKFTGEKENFYIKIK